MTDDILTPDETPSGEPRPARGPHARHYRTPVRVWDYLDDLPGGDAAWSSLGPQLDLGDARAEVWCPGCATAVSFVQELGNDSEADAFERMARYVGPGSTIPAHPGPPPLFLLLPCGHVVDTFVTERPHAAGRYPPVPPAQDVDAQFAEVARGADGRVCARCDGDGDCQVCDGQGFNGSTAAVDCPACSGKGLCRPCRGSGAAPSPWQVLATPMGINPAKADTVGGYLAHLLFGLWSRQGEFNPAAPFGLTGWPDDIYRALIGAGYVTGDLTHDGWIDVDREHADQLVAAAIRHAFGVPARA